MNEIKTGYTPEFGLGAFFQGVNAANADAFNEEELLKQRLANQQSQVMNPLEAQLKQLSVAPAKYEEALSKARLTDPDYIRSMLNERKGQAALAEVTGRKAKALEPFAIKAEQGKLENEFEDTDLLRRFRTGQYDLLAGGGKDSTTGQVVPYTPAQRQAAQNYNQGLLGILKNTLPNVFFRETFPSLISSLVVEISINKLVLSIPSVISPASLTEVLLS